MVANVELEIICDYVFETIKSSSRSKMNSEEANISRMMKQVLDALEYLHSQHIEA